MDRKKQSLMQLLAFSVVLIGGQAFAASDQMPQTVSVTELRAEYQQSIRSGHWRGARQAADVHQNPDVHQTQRHVVTQAPVHNDVTQGDNTNQNQQYERQDQQPGHRDDGAAKAVMSTADR